MSEPSGEYCTRYVTYDYDHPWNPCRCPNCGSFLPSSFPMDKPFNCPKCGEVLEIIPDVDKVTGKEDHYKGRICMKPDHLKTEEEKEEQRRYMEWKRSNPRPKRRKKTDKWAMGEGFARRVWVGADGEFIKINGERVSIEDERILLIYEGDLSWEVKT
ncbi:MAG: hypothetical protein ACTSPB_01480 [Candidatus Thorarchaeota archaeon]